MNAQVHIDTLRFKGNDSRRQRFINRLEQSAWSGLEDREYVFIRSLAASGQADHLAEQVVSAAVDARLRAVNGWQVRQEDEPAVYFVSLAELLASLIIALIHNRPTWYWKQWRSLFEQSYSQALMGIWEQYRREIPAVTAHLARHGELRVFWDSIEEPTAKTLLTALLPGTAEFSEEPTTKPGVDDINIPHTWLNRWQSVCAGGADDWYRTQLAALLILQEWQPLALQMPFENGYFHAVVLALQNPTYPANRTDSGNERVNKATPTNDSVGSPVFDRESTTPDDDFHQSHYESIEESKHTSEPSEENSGQQTDTVQSGSRTLSAAMLVDPVNSYQSAEPIDDSPVNTQVLTQASTIEQVKSGFLPSVDNDAEKRFQVEQGGLFYLLNFLNLPTVQAQLLTGIAHPLTISGWGWLYRLGQALGLEQEAALQQLLVFLCGFDDIDSLEQLPLLENLDRLLSLGRQRYSERLFNAALLAIPAEVQVDGTHVDVFYALHDVRLEVRQAGLDLDPGWLSWLGKVVSFHYRSFA